MAPKLWTLVLALVILIGIGIILPCLAPAGETISTSYYKVLPAIQHGNLTVFPVVAVKIHDTQEFLTLDDGLRSGEVIVTESGSVRPLIRKRRPIPNSEGGGAQVNQLVLVNNSKRALILLAGEIVTGGKQDRIIGADRIVPPESDPIDLGVFCVEPGRWTGTSMSFRSLDSAMAQPTLRAKAMGDKDQQKVWSEVGKTREALALAVPSATAPAIAGTTSYARVIENDEVKQKLESVVEPIQHSYQGLIKQLREQNAVGVVAAVNGQIVWADLFASTDLLQKYWPKLVRSYAAEAVVTRAKRGEVDAEQAQHFLNRMEGRHETVDSEPGLYRHTEISGDGFKAFELTSLLPKTGFDLHIAKMAE
jgi:hypothetical protein